MDDVHRIHVHAREPFHHRLELRGDVIKVEIVTLDGIDFGSDLFSAELVASAVYGVKQTLREIRARTKELHLLAHKHRRNATGDRPVVSPRPAHKRVALELQRTRIDGDLRGELAKI